MYVYTEIYTINDNISEMKGYTGTQETLLLWIWEWSHRKETLFLSLLYIAVFKNHQHVLFYNIIKTLKVFKNLSQPTAIYVTLTM